MRKESTLVFLKFYGNRNVTYFVGAEVDSILEAAREQKIDFDSYEVVRRPAVATQVSPKDLKRAVAEVVNEEVDAALIAHFPDARRLNRRLEKRLGI